MRTQWEDWPFPPARPSIRSDDTQPRPVVSPTSPRRWRRRTLWGVPAAFIAGMLTSGALSAASEPPTETFTTVHPSVTPTGAPTLALHGARLLPDGRSVVTLADGRVMTGTPARGARVHVGPTTLSGSDGAAAVIRYYRCLAAADPDHRS